MLECHPILKPILHVAKPIVHAVRHPHHHIVGARHHVHHAIRHYAGTHVAPSVMTVCNKVAGPLLAGGLALLPPASAVPSVGGIGGFPANVPSEYGAPGFLAPGPFAGPGFYGPGGYGPGGYGPGGYGPGGYGPGGYGPGGYGPGGYGPGGYAPGYIGGPALFPAGFVAPPGRLDWSQLPRRCCSRAPTQPQPLRSRPPQAPPRLRPAQS